MYNIQKKRQVIEKKKKKKASRELSGKLNFSEMKELLCVKTKDQNSSYGKRKSQIYID